MRVKKGTYTHCTIENCDLPGKKKNGKELFTLGLCNSHYQKHMRQEDNRRAVYHKMINRCTNPNNDSYPTYGGRGITVDSYWLPENDGFRHFCEEMGSRPTTKTKEGRYLYTLDRIDNNHGYTAMNCRWAPIHIQNNNRRDNRVRSDDTWLLPSQRFRGVTFRKFKYKNGKKYINKKSHWCASIWIDNQHIRIYLDDRETAISARMGLEMAFLGRTLDEID